MIELVGNMHIHTMYSDGTATHREAAEAAARRWAGLDHCHRSQHLGQGRGGYYDNVLLLVAKKSMTVVACRKANHLLVYGADCELATLAPHPQAVIDAARERGALTFLAHPVEYASRVAGEAALGWESWDVTGYYRHRDLELHV